MWQKRFEKRLPLLYLILVQLSRIGMVVEAFAGGDADGSSKCWFDWLEDRSQAEDDDDPFDIDGEDAVADRDALLTAMGKMT